MHVFARLKMGGIRKATSYSMISPQAGLEVGVAGNMHMGGAPLTEVGLTASAYVSLLQPPTSCASGSSSQSLHPLQNLVPPHVRQQTRDLLHQASCLNNA